MNYRQLIKSFNKNEVSKYKIYALIINQDWSTYKAGDIFYIGITERSLGTRRSGHLNKVGNNVGFGIMLIENTNNPGRESFYIDFFNKLGCNLMNISGGRVGIREPKERVRMTDEEKLLNRQKYYEENRDRLTSNMRKYQENNKERLQRYRREYYKNKREKSKIKL